MKRIMLSIVLILTLLMSFISCNESTATIYDTLNELSKQNYSKIQLAITTVTDDIELKANYILTASKVDYSVEQLNLLPSDGNFSGANEEYKTLINGSAAIENGAITDFGGEAVDIPEYDELKGHFDFKENYFKNIKIENGKLSADVESASEFLGTDKAISDAKLIVEFDESAIKSITITYKTTTSVVTSVYLFEK